MTHDTELATKMARAELMKRALIIATFAIAAASLVILLVIVSQIRATQQTGSPILKAVIGQQEDIKRAADNAQETNEQILDCLDPAGQCYKDSRASTDETVASINEISQYAAVCADRPGSQSLEEIRRCISDLIAASNPPRPDQPES